VIALDADSGTLRWYYQFTPNDAHDRDAIEQPLLAEIQWQGDSRRALLQANRNGFFYALDRTSGEFLFAKPFVTQNWAAGLDANGRPIVRPEAKPSREGALVWPGVAGGTNWWPPSLDASRGLVYIPAVDAAGIFYRQSSKFKRGTMYLGGAGILAPTQPSSAAIKAVESNSGEIRWEATLASPLGAAQGVSGVLSTAGGLVFAGYGDEFHALDADTGQILWTIRLGGRVAAPPVAYAVKGTQYISVLAGLSLFSFALPVDTQ
jgi:alcohol dehydrogenase (cytochrome c)